MNDTFILLSLDDLFSTTGNIGWDKFINMKVDRNCISHGFLIVHDGVVQL